MSSVKHKRGQYFKAIDNALSMYLAPSIGCVYIAHINFVEASKNGSQEK